MFERNSPNQQCNEKKHRSRFMESLYNTIDKKLYPELLVWGPGGKSFIIPDTREFEQKVLPFLCSHTNFASFVRQLNMYCFKKRRVGLNPNASSYSHPCFVEGKMELLDNIVRKNPRKIALLKKNLHQQEEETEYSELYNQNLFSANDANELHKKIFASDENMSQPIESVQLMQNIIDEVVTQTNNEADNGIMDLIQNYLRDDEDVANESYNNAEEYKKQVIERNYWENEIQLTRKNAKNLVGGYSNYNGVSGPSYHHETDSFVHVDVAMPHQQMQDWTSDENLKHSYRFRARDFLECQNLISSMMNWRNRSNGGFSPLNSGSGMSFERDYFSENSPDTRY